MTREALLDFMRSEKYAVQTSVSPGGLPQAAVVGIAVSDRFEIVFDTLDSSRKAPNLRANPVAALVVDRYEEDWSRLGWVMLQGKAEILESGDEHDLAQASLRARYPQLAAMRIEGLPVVAVRIDHVASWGRLEDD